MVSNFNINLSIWLLLDFKRLKAWLMAKPFNIVPGECAYSPSAATPQLREILCPWVKNAWRDQTPTTGCSHSHILVNVSLRYCVWGTRTQPLIFVRLLCIVGRPVQLISEVFSVCMCRHTFASLWGACLCFASLWRTNSHGDSCVLSVHLSNVCWGLLFCLRQSVHLLKVCWIYVKRTYFKSLLKVYYRSVFAESSKTFIFKKFRRPLCHNDRWDIKSFISAIAGEWFPYDRWTSFSQRS